MAPVPAAAKPVAPVLEPGVAVERSLPLGAKDEIPLSLEAGQYLHVCFDGRGLDLTLSLLGPGGEEIVVRRGAKESRLSWTTTTGGAYRLAVSSPAARALARYRITLKELRLAGPGDEERVAADAALSEAKRFQREKQHDLAVQRARDALSRWQKVQDLDGEFDTLVEIGILYEARSPDQALLWNAKALEQALAAGSLPNQARARTLIGTLLMHSDPGKACPYLEAALPIWRDLRDSYQQSWVLYHLGIASQLRGKLGDSIELYREALSLANPSWSLTPVIQNGLCYVYTSRGESQQSFDCFEQALKLAVETGTAGAEATARTGLGNLYRRRGEHQKALSEFQKAFEINQSDPDLEQYTRSVQLLIGSVHLDLGQTAEALQEFQQALVAFQRAGDAKGISNSFWTLGKFNLATSRDEEALKRFQDSLTALGDQDLPKARGLAFFGLGVAQLNLKQVSEAVKSLREAVPFLEKTDRLNMAFVQQRLGEAYQAQGDLAAADAALGEALRIAQEVRAPFFQAPIYFDLARLERRKGNLQEAVSRMEKAITILEAVRSDLADDRSRTSFFASLRSYYDFYVDLLMELDRRNPGRGYAEAALAASDKGRARGLLDLLSQGRLELTRGISAELLSEEREVRARLSQVQRDLMDALSSQVFDKDSEKDSEKRQARLALVGTLEAQQKEFDERQRKIEQRIKNSHPLYYQVRYPSPLNQEEIRKLIQPDEALLEYSLGEEGAYLFVVTTDGLKAHRLALSPQQIAADVRKIQKTLEGPETPSALFRYKAYDLYQALVAPAESEIGGRRRLLIAPDGILNYLPFDVLLTRQADDESSLPYLVRSFSVSYIPSASVFASLSLPRSPVAAGDGPAKRFLAFAPDYPSAPAQGQARSDGPEVLRGGDSPGKSLSSLEGAQQEVRKIADQYRPEDVTLYLGPDANRKNFEKNPLAANRIHFAGHGVLDEERPENSALVLTDGQLLVSDIFNLELKSDLVVLAACKTAGKQVTGEGLVGLTRAFLYAGAPSVVVTLWEVADSSTSGLMVEFYRNLGRTGDKAEALRQAKLAMLEKQGRLSAPYYWAPFILVGKPR